MAFTHQIAVELIDPKTAEIIEPLSPQTGDYTISIQAADGWSITGKYYQNTLQAIHIQKSVSDGRK